MHFGTKNYLKSNHNHTPKQSGVIDDLAWNVDGPWTKIESNCFLIFFKATPTFHFNIARIIYKKNLQTIFFFKER